MASRFSLAADISPTVDERAAEREASDLAGVFEEEMGNLGVGVDGGGVDSLAGGAGTGAGGMGGAGVLGAGAAAGRTSGLAGALGSAGGMLGTVALGGAIGFGIMQGVQKLSEASPALQQTGSMLGEAMSLFFRPFGNFLSGVLRPFATAGLNMAIQFNQLYSENGLAVAIGAIAQRALTSLGTAVGGAVADTIGGEADLSDLFTITGVSLTAGAVLSSIGWPTIGATALLGAITFDRIGKGDLLGSIFSGSVTGGAVLGVLFGATTITGGAVLGAIFGGTSVVVGDVMSAVFGNVSPSEGDVLGVIFAGLTLTAAGVLTALFGPVTITAGLVVGAVWAGVTIGGAAVIDAIDWPSISTGQIISAFTGPSSGTEPDLPDPDPPDDDSGDGDDGQFGFGIVPELPVSGPVGIGPLAQGSVVSRPRRATVGEAGPEAVMPLDRLSREISRAIRQGNAGQTGGRDREMQQVADTLDTVVQELRRTRQAIEQQDLSVEAQSGGDYDPF